MWQCQNELARGVELRPDARHLAWVDGDGVFEAGLPGFGRRRYGPRGHLDRPVHLVHVDILPVDSLEDDLVNVHGVGVKPKD
jgi:hypothetical protein